MVFLELLGGRAAKFLGWSRKTLATRKTNRLLPLGARTGFDNQSSAIARCVHKEFFTFSKLDF
jgi:hypothetical protein